VASLDIKLKVDCQAACPCPRPNSASDAGHQTLQSASLIEVVATDPGSESRTSTPCQVDRHPWSSQDAADGKFPLRACAASSSIG